MLKTDNNSGQNPDVVDTDVILIGAGIMSATLGALLKELQPDLSIQVFERLDVAAAESSDAWNNAGTGHSAFCELNYTPELSDGSIETIKAINIAESFEVSKQFWAYLVQKGLIETPDNFIRSIPHMSFVWGEKDVDFLKKRYAALQRCNLFKGMVYTEDLAEIEAWMPLIMKGRDRSQKVAATRMDLGTDVNFGTLTRSSFHHLDSLDGVSLHFNHEVKKLSQQADGSWELGVKELKTGKERAVGAKFVFIGAGGGSLPLLLRTGIPESKGFGGFPVSGQWLKCVNPEIIEKHRAKVYGKAAVGSPPMSVPHLDTRVINGKKELLFGPYAGFTMRFLKSGSMLDLPSSVKSSNLQPMLSAGMRNLPLTKYLIDQVRQTPDDRLEALREFVPTAQLEDWELEIAGQRVQVIKRDVKNGGGVLEFGTEVVSAADGSIAALLGASPGASTTVSIMLNMLQICFKDKMNTPEWQMKLKEMIPSYGQQLCKNSKLCEETRAYTSQVLGLDSAQKDGVLQITK